MKISRSTGHVQYQQQQQPSSSSISSSSQFVLLTETKSMLCAGNSSYLEALSLPSSPLSHPLLHPHAPRHHYSSPLGQLLHVCCTLARHAAIISDRLQFIHISCDAPDAG